MTATVEGPSKQEGITITFEQLNTQVHTMFSGLASLLAGERLVVYTGKFETASFDLKNRCIFMPELQGVSMDVYEMFLAHEVSHGLHTPGGRHGTDDWETAARRVCPEYPEIGMAYVNVVEDARIEKLICRKFYGVKRKMLRGYSEVYEKNILGIREYYETKGDDMILIDRINLRTKLGEFFDVQFEPGENIFVKRTYETETFEEVVQLAIDIFNYSKQQEQEKMKKSMENAQNARDREEAMKEFMEKLMERLKAGTEGKFSGAMKGFLVKGASDKYLKAAIEAVEAAREENAESESREKSDTPASGYSRTTLNVKNITVARLRKMMQNPASYANGRGIATH